jgi:PAS domain S-box-containing protein
VLDDGDEVRNLRATFVPVTMTDEPGRVVAVYTCDVTQQAAEVDLLAKQTSLLRARLEKEPEARPRATPSSYATRGDCLVITEPGGLIIDVNAAFAAMVGRSRSELIGTPAAGLFRPEDADAFFVHERRLRDREIDLVAGSGHLRHADGSWIPIRAAVKGARDEDDNLQSVVIRITPRDRAVVLAGSRESEETPKLRNRVAQLERLVLRMQAVLDEAEPRKQIVARSRWWAERSRLDRLSARELEIVSHLVEGMRPPSIARLMHLSPSTVRNHLSGIYRKVGVNSQEELIKVLRESAGASLPG